MTMITLERPEHKKIGRSAEAEGLAHFLLNHFPEEAASTDVSDDKSVVELAIVLLKRLQRWES